MFESTLSQLQCKTFTSHFLPQGRSCCAVNEGNSTDLQNTPSLLPGERDSLNVCWRSLKIHGGFLFLQKFSNSSLFVIFEGRWMWGSFFAAHVKAEPWARSRVTCWPCCPLLRGGRCSDAMRHNENQDHPLSLSPGNPFSHHSCTRKGWSLSRCSFPRSAGYRDFSSTELLSLRLYSELLSVFASWTICCF